jgi:hypothetical protein
MWANLSIWGGRILIARQQTVTKMEAATQKAAIV